MDADTFAAAIKLEKTRYLQALKNGQGEAGQMLRSLPLAGAQAECLWQALDTALTDLCYTLLLGLDGAAALGDHQQGYTLLDETGTPVFEAGELEAQAFRHFHEAA